MTIRSSLMWSTQWYQIYNGNFWFLLSTVLYSQLTALNRAREVNELYQKHEYWIYWGILFVAIEATNKIPKASSQFITRKHIVINMRAACRRLGRVLDIWVPAVTFNVATLFWISHSSYLIYTHVSEVLLAGRQLTSNKFVLLTHLCVAFEPRNIYKIEFNGSLCMARPPSNGMVLWWHCVCVCVLPMNIKSMINVLLCLPNRRWEILPVQRMTLSQLITAGVIRVRLA